MHSSVFDVAQDGEEGALELVKRWKPRKRSRGRSVSSSFDHVSSPPGLACWYHPQSEMSSPESISFTFVSDDGSEVPTTQDFRNALQKGSDEVKCDTIRKIIVATLNGSPQVNT